MKRDDALLNARDIAALNRARNVLRRLEDDAWKKALTHFDPYAPVSGWHLGLLSDAATVADDAIFHVLNIARHNCDLKITDAQLAVTEPDRTGTALPTDAPKPSTRRPLARAGRRSVRQQP